MKTDKFDDAIRRKLESIEPPFRERDWSHMQAFMYRHGYPPAWAGASQWLVPMAAAAAVTGVIISMVWQFHTNQQLSQSVQALSQTVARLETTQQKLIKLQHRTDTVYVTNFTKTPAPVNADQQPFGQSTPNVVPSIRTENRYSLQPAPVPASPGQRSSESGSQGTVSPTYPTEPALAVSATKNRLAQRTQPVRPPSEQRSDERQTRDAEATPGSGTPTDRTVADESVGLATTPKPDRERAQPDRSQTLATTTNPAVRPDRFPAPGASGNEAATSPSTIGRSGRNKSVSGSTYAATKSSTRRNGGQRYDAGSPPSDDQADTRQIETIDALSNRPTMPLSLDSAYYAESIARRTRRIRSLLPPAFAVVVPAAKAPTTAAPTEVASSRPNYSGVRVRLGVTGEVGSIQRALGAYSEVLIGKHWSVGVGLNKLHVQGGQFDNADQFQKMTNNDFRRIYAPRIDPVHDIINIDRQFTLWQVPVNVSYRALLGKGFALAPSVGMDFSLSARENTTFSYRRGPYEYNNVAGIPPSRPCDLFNTYTVALGAEKSWKHLVLQAGPVLTTPTKSLPDPINPVSLGFRTRVLFQF